MRCHVGAVHRRMLFVLVSGSVLACAPADSPHEAPHEAPPVVRLTAATDSLSEGLSVIASVRELADGRVLVSDEKDERLVLADFEGDSIVSLGRQGDGPGEYRQLSRIWPLGSDSTLLKEPFAPRVLLLRGDTIVATLGAGDSLLQQVGMGPLAGVDSVGHLLWLDYGRGANGRPALEDSMVLVRLDRRTQRVDTVTRVQSAAGWSREAGKDAGAADVVVAAEGGAPSTRTYAIALAAPDEVAVFPDGWVAIVRANPYRVDWCAPDARCTQGRTMDATRREMSDREKRAYLAVAESSQTWPPTTNVEETAGWPAIVPAFATPTSRIDASAAIALADGRLMVERLPNADTPHRRYDVITRDGTVTQQLELSLVERVVGASGRYLYVVRVDPNGLQRLRRHALP